MSVKRKVEEPESDPKPDTTTKIPACQRCKIKKIKCDQNFPKCAKCARIGTECMVYDPIVKREVSRIYMLQLEDRIKVLESRLRKNGIDVENDDTPPAVGTVSIASEKGHESNISFSRLMSTAMKVNSYKKYIPILQNPSIGKRDSTTIGNQSIPIIPAILPPKVTALEFLQIFFAQSNSQLPILHREEFLRKYFVPIYGNTDFQGILLASNYSKINLAFVAELQPDEPPWFDQFLEKFEMSLQESQDQCDESIRKISSNVRPPKKFHKALYFLNMIFAIASSVKHLQYPINISASFRFAAGKYFEKVHSSSDHLESLQGILLFAVYSTMRPTYPGVWYTLGSALRLCVDLDLHNELNTKYGELDPFIVDKRRRLFWCTYLIDRQICFYLNRPIGLHDESINTPFPSELDDAEILPLENSNLVINNDGKPSYKSVALSMIKIRQIQSELQRVLYTNAEVPRRYGSLEEWKIQIIRRVHDWKHNCPKTPEEMNCDYNIGTFDLNYYHTLLNIYGLSPKNYKLSTEDFVEASSAARGLIETYTSLLASKSINYTWAAVHNLFMAGSSYLYTIYNCEAVREKNNLAEVKMITSDCLSVLGSLIDTCDAAKNCRDVFKNLSIVIIKLKYGESVSATNTEVSQDMLRKIDVRANNSLPKLMDLLNQEKTAKEGASFNEILWNEVLPSLEEEVPSSFNWTTANSVDLDNKLDYNELDSFFKELENGAITNQVPEAAPPNYFDFSNIPMAPSTSFRTLEGQKAYEEMRKMPNEIIWDQFFSAPAHNIGMDPGLVHSDDDLFS